MEEYLTDMQINGLTKATLKNKRTLVNQFAEWNGDKDIEDIRSIHIKKYIQHQLDKGLKPVSINTIIKQLKVFFDWCVKEDIISKNPMDDKIKLLKQGKTMIKTYSDANIKALVSYYNGISYLQVRNKTMIIILVETGIRNSELRNIKLDDLIDDVIIVKGKGRTRTVLISMHLQKQLKKYMRIRNQYPKAKECPYLIVSTMGGQVSIDVPLDVLKRAGKAVGVNVKLLVHSIRRYYAQAMLDKVDLYTVSRLLGHSNFSTTQIYVQSTEHRTIIKRGMNSPLSSI